MSKNTNHQSSILLLDFEIPKEVLDSVEAFINKMRYKFQVYGMNKDKEIYIVRKDEDPWLKFVVHTNGRWVTKIVQCVKRTPCEHDLNPNKWVTVWKRGLFS